MHAVVGRSHGSRLADEHENEHGLIDLQRHISGGIAASCAYTYIRPAPLFRGSVTCQACNKWSNQPRVAIAIAAIGEGEAANTALP